MYFSFLSYFINSTNFCNPAGVCDIAFTDCLLIAVTDNLGYVSFEYCVDGTENSDGSTTLTVTEADADALAGQSVKAMSQTPAGLQKLVELIK